jgi:hypothetical protein
MNCHAGGEMIGARQQEPWRLLYLHDIGSIAEAASV